MPCPIKPVSPMGDYPPFFNYILSKSTLWLPQHLSQVILILESILGPIEIMSQVLNGRHKRRQLFEKLYDLKTNLLPHNTTQRRRSLRITVFLTVQDGVFSKASRPSVRAKLRVLVQIPNSPYSKLRLFSYRLRSPLPTVPYFTRRL